MSSCDAVAKSNSSLSVTLMRLTAPADQFLAFSRWYAWHGTSDG